MLLAPVKMVHFIDERSAGIDLPCRQHRSQQHNCASPWIGQRLQCQSQFHLKQLELRLESIFDVRYYKVSPPHIPALFKLCWSSICFQYRTRGSVELWIVPRKRN